MNTQTRKHLNTLLYQLSENRFGLGYLSYYSHCNPNDDCNFSDLEQQHYFICKEIAEILDKEVEDE